jgi:hypothetical protein
LALVADVVNAVAAGLTLLSIDVPQEKRGNIRLPVTGGVAEVTAIDRNRAQQPWQDLDGR